MVSKFCYAKKDDVIVTIHKPQKDILKCGVISKIYSNGADVMLYNGKTLFFESKDIEKDDGFDNDYDIWTDDYYENMESYRNGGLDDDDYNDAYAAESLISLQERYTIYKEERNNVEKAD